MEFQMFFIAEVTRETVLPSFFSPLLINYTYTADHSLFARFLKPTFYEIKVFYAYFKLICGPLFDISAHYSAESSLFGDIQKMNLCFVSMKVCKSSEFLSMLKFEKSQVQNRVSL